MLSILVALSVILVVDAIRQEKKIDHLKDSTDLKTYEENIH